MGQLQRPHVGLEVAVPGQQPLQLSLLPPLQLRQGLVVPQQSLLLSAGLLLGAPRRLHLLLQQPQLPVQLLALRLQYRLLGLGQSGERSRGLLRGASQAGKGGKGWGGQKAEGGGKERECRGAEGQGHKAGRGQVGLGRPEGRMAGRGGEGWRRGERGTDGGAGGQQAGRSGGRGRAVGRRGWGAGPTCRRLLFSWAR